MKFKKNCILNIDTPIFKEWTETVHKKKWDCGNKRHNHMSLKTAEVCIKKRKDVLKETSKNNYNYPNDEMRDVIGEEALDCLGITSTAKKYNVSKGIVASSIEDFLHKLFCEKYPGCNPYGDYYSGQKSGYNTLRIELVNGDIKQQLFGLTGNRRMYKHLIGRK